MNKRNPRSPAGLKEPGKALWKAILSDLEPDVELDKRELHLLGRACRTEDEIAALEQAVDRDGVTVNGSRGQVVSHPALTEARHHRLVQLRLLSAISTERPEQGDDRWRD